MKRDEPAVVPRVHVGACSQQVVHHVLTAKTCRWAQVKHQQYPNQNRPFFEILKSQHK